jgi:ribosome recycling factor
MASLAVPEPRLIVVQPWDKTALGDIEKAILKSDLGLNPVNDGKIIRLPIPALTTDRRKDLVKMVKKMEEEAKVAIRNIRRDANEMLKDLKQEKEITEDELFRAQEEVQERTDRFISQVDDLCATKEKEILEI